MPGFDRNNTSGLTHNPPAGGGSGTVTTVSVATANGFSGSVANPTTAPAITVTMDTSHPSAHTWAATQTFTLAPVFTDASGTRTALGLGTLATQSGTFSGTSSGTNTGDTAVGADGYTVLVQAADQDVTGATFSTDSTNLQFSVTAGNSYLVEGLVAMGGSAAAADSAYRFNVAAGTQTGYGQAQGPGSSLTAQNTLISAAGAAATGTATVGGTGTVTNPVASRFAYAFTASNTTTFSLQFGNLVTTGGAVSRLMKGSNLRYKQIT